VSKWEMVKLKNICNFIDYRGKTPAKSDSGIPFITAKNVKNNKFTFEPREYITKETYDIIMVRGYPQIGDILFTTEAPLGNVTRIPFIEGEFAVGQRIIVMQPHSGVLSSEYLDYALKSSTFQDMLWKHSSGSTVKGIRSAELVKLEIPLPPLEIQMQIAKTLDTAAELLAMRKHLLAELDNLIKSTFYDMFGDPVANGKGWEMKHISKCCTINPKKSEIDWFTDDLLVSFVSMSNVSEKGEIKTNDVREYKSVKTGFTYFYENDVLFAKITPCMENGKGAIAKNLKNNIGFGSTEFHVLRPMEGLSNSVWLYHLTVLPVFRKDAEKNMSGSAGQKRVPISFFNSFVVPLPPIELQNQFSNIVTEIEEQKALVKKAIDEAQYLFDSLMSEYFE
jgi:type I restriction enzyme, S subunit